MCRLVNNAKQPQVLEPIGDPCSSRPMASMDMVAPQLLLAALNPLGYTTHTMTIVVFETECTFYKAILSMLRHYFVSQ
jgi:hypothetical protein